ncbi:citryl-CoA lyase [Streptomyces sp. NPDC055078]
MAKTHISTSTADRIEIYGHDLCQEVIGHTDLGSLVFLGAHGRLPDEAEAKMFNAILVGMAEHGLTPIAMAARLTLMGAPEAAQGAIAAGILGAGSVFLGVLDNTGELLASGRVMIDEGSSLKKVAEQLVNDAERAGALVPGFGHSLHKPIDPRTLRFFELATELGFMGRNVELMQEIGRVMSERRGKPITLNGAGAAGAVLADMGFDWRITRACVVAARAAGLVGHLAEEMRSGRKEGVASAVLKMAHHDVEYSPRPVPPRGA